MFVAIYEIIGLKQCEPFNFHTLHDHGRCMTWNKTGVHTDSYWPTAGTELVPEPQTHMLNIGSRFKKVFYRIGSYLTTHIFLLKFTGFKLSAYLK